MGRAREVRGVSGLWQGASESLSGRGGVARSTRRRRTTRLRPLTPVRASRSLAVGVGLVQRLSIAGKARTRLRLRFGAATANVASGRRLENGLVARVSQGTHRRKKGIAVPLI